MNSWGRRLPGITLGLMVLAVLWHGPIAQLANYHDFADRSVRFGVPHFADVISNVGFALVALWGGIALTFGRSGRGIGYQLFVVALFLTALGSTWYHLAPGDARLVWDRLPIALACAGLLAGVWGDTRQRDDTWVAVGLMLFGVASVVWWRYSNLAGQEDLRPYLLLQIAPMILIPWWQWLYDSPRADRSAFGIALLLYGAAKLAEIYDHQIGAVLYGLTGHTLKHLLATAAAALIVFRLAKRSVAVVGPTATERLVDHQDLRRDAVEPHQPTRNQGRNMFRAVLRFILRLVFRIEQRGDPSVFVNERTLIVANHESFIDGLLIGLMIPVDAIFVVHSQIVERPFFAFLLRFVPHLVVDSTSPLAIKQIVRLVESGQPVVIFPEGRITKTGSLMKVYDGAAFVAAKTGATLVPVRIDGAARSYFGRLGGLYPRKLFPKVTISVQPRRTLPMPDLPRAKDRRRRCGELMRGILLDMLVATRPQHTLYEAFLDGRRAFGNGYKLVEDVRLVEESYGSLLKKALGLSRVTSRLAAPDEIVGLLMPNAAITVSLVLGLSLNRRVPAMLNYTAGVDGLRAACTAAGIRTIIASRTFIERARLEPVVEQLDGIAIRYIEDFRAQIGLADKLWMLWHMLFPASAAVPQTPDEAAVVLFTSGSEGKPKGVVHSHSSVLANVAQIRAVADFTPRDKIMMALPLFHSFGLTCGLLLPLVSGCKVFLYPSPLHYRIIPEIVYDRDCTVLFGTSTFLGNYGKFAHPYDFGRLRYVVAGAEKLSPEVRALWVEKFGISLLEGYGVTECAPVIAVNVPMACRIGSVGQLMPGMQCQIEPVPGIERGGALHVAGPNVMKGYLLFDQPGVLRAPDAPAPGWYSTGDVVERDADGFIHILGRIKRFAKIAGEMVSLEVVERNAAQAAPGFAHAASTRTDAAKGEAVVLFTTAPTLTREQLSAAAKAAGSPELSVPRLIRHVQTIPLLGTGKTDYVALKRMAESDSVDQADVA